MIGRFKFCFILHPKQGYLMVFLLVGFIVVLMRVMSNYSVILSHVFFFFFFLLHTSIPGPQAPRVL